MTPQHVRMINYYAFHIFLVLCMVHPLLTLKIEKQNSIVCEEGAVKEDPSDCASYFQCLDGKTVKQRCHSESYFDPAWEVCVIDVDGICKPITVNCTEGDLEENPKNSCGYLKCLNGSLVEVNCTSGSYFNTTLNICLIDENGVCSSIPEECIDGEITVDPEDPCGYLKCVNESLVKVNCSSGSYFNSTLDICLVDENGVCSSIPEECIDGEITVDPEDPCGYLKCVNESLVKVNCTSGSYFNSTLNICLIDENGVCSSIPEDCIDGEIKEDPEDPCGYLKCVNGSLAEVNCTSGSYFNSTLNICLIDENGVCSSIPEDCIDGEIKEDPEDPCGYLKCVNESLVKVNCTSGSYFNSTLNICLIDENGVCSSISEKCIEGEIEENPEDSCGYLQCLNGSLEIVNCSSGSYFNSTLQTCLIDENGVCSLISESCIEGELQEDTKECSGYLQCINGEMVNQLCSYGYYFHSELKSCVVDNNGVCTPITENCEEGDRETDAEDCTMYVECIDGDFVAQKCAKGSYFEFRIKACVIDENFVCIPHVD
ncbi:protein psiG isoform X1 [Drosophila innubila]|uniref:protein psiG isoform X1 n=1 Tax=Drosophila innubila TaxID=198719 RepID=UPI00148B99C7|nr:protein psiG isoform X1 [Drosophila innubila]